MKDSITYNKFNPIWEPIDTADQEWRNRVDGRKLVIEIGPGVGLHPIQYAKSNPDKFVVAIEKTSEKYAKFARRLENHSEINNLFAICCFNHCFEVTSTSLF